jgi:steroid delta-isomerase-like uncharacterized protein
MEMDMTDKSQIERNRRVVEEFLDGTHSGRFEVIEDAVAENVVTHGFPGGNPNSRESYRDWFLGFQSGFTVVGFDVPIMVADENAVAVRWIFTVDHTGPFAGVPATGKRVVFDGTAIYRLENGLIAETWLNIDQLSLLGQVGALPAMAMAA